MKTRTPTAHFPDVSHWEAEVDFHAVAAAGAPLVSTKCTEGDAYTDPTYADFAARIRSVPGLRLQAYVFEDVDPEGPQVSHFLSTAHLRKGDVQPVVDAETLGLSRAATFAALADLDRRGFRPIPYCSLAFWRDVLGAPTDRPLWLADYRDELPELPDDLTLFAWQHTQGGSFPGVARPCDCNYLYVPVADLPRYCI